jgi:hypothetical protein
MGIRIALVSALIVAAGACAGAPLPSPSGAAAHPPAPPEENPRVEPGLVRWHPGFEAACRAAAASGKPVLLFDMLGRLDREHC